MKKVLLVMVSLSFGIVCHAPKVVGERFYRNGIKVGIEAETRVPYNYKIFSTEQPKATYKGYKLKRSERIKSGYWGYYY